MKEIRFYLINLDNTSLIVKNVTNDVFITEAERLGTVYSKNGFETAFNENLIDMDNSYLRILEA